jgi:Secretion system C-terminal sorting domain
LFVQKVAPYIAVTHYTMRLLHKLYIVLTIVAFTPPSYLPAQDKADQIWMLGAYGGTLDWYRGLMYFDFSTDPPVATEIEVPAATLRDTRSNMCDSSGQLLFYTNGCLVQNKQHALMQNGNEINIDGYGYQTWCSDAYAVAQSTLILPLPGSAYKYVLLHAFADRLPLGDLAITELRSTTIDMALEGGLGAVIQKNDIIASKRFGFGKLTACRHANGVDWWIPLNEAGSNDVYMFLLDSTGVHLSHVQENIGKVTDLLDRFGQAVFSPDGQFYARFDAFNELDIFRFDRCRGLLFAPLHLEMEIDEQNWLGCGVAFSPNSKYLYASGTYNLYQLDMQAPDIAASKVLVAEYDGFVDFQATTMYQQQLGPDGRIYMCCTSESRFLHVINTPNESAANCGLVQHGIELPNLSGVSLPNFPYFRLGAATAGYCDSIGLVSGVKTPLSGSGSALRFTPNPANDLLQIQYSDTPISGTLTVTDITGRVIFAEKLDSRNSTIQTGAWANGVYYAVFTAADGQRQTNKVVIQH